MIEDIQARDSESTGRGASTMAPDAVPASLLEARGLSKTFGDVRALVDLDLAVSGGEILCLLGANGAGKTTTINLFLGFLEPTSGSLLVAGVDASKQPLEARRRLAYIPEQVALYPRLSGLVWRIVIRVLC